MSRQARDAQLFDAAAERYSRKDVVRSSSIARKAQLLHAVSPLLARSPGLGAIIEVGCGIGAAATYLQGHYERYLGIDHSPGMIEHARRFNQHVPGTTFLASDAPHAALPRDSADLILAVGALHHISDVDRTMAALRDAAKPGAWFVAIEPQNGNPLIQLMRGVRQNIDEHYSKEQVFFSEAALVGLLERAGLAEITTTYHGFLTPPFAQVVMNPQAVFEPLSRAAVRFDAWCAARLPHFVNRLTFNLIVRGVFRK
jgi:SAM-dependent methyltransferase